MSRPLQLRVIDQTLLPGRLGGLAQPTALVDIGVGGVFDAGTLARIRTGATALAPGQRLAGVGESDWPAVFLVDRSGSDAAPERRLGEWVIAVAVALQRWAGDPAWRGRVLAVEPGMLAVAIPWRRDDVLTDTVRLALQLVELWAGSPDGQAPEVNTAIRAGMDAARAGGLRPNVVRCVLAALERGIPVELRPGHVQYGWGAQMVQMHATLTGRTSHIATRIAQDKAQTVQILGAAGLPVPRGAVVADIESARCAATDLGWPVVVKPLDQDQGRGVVAGIRDEVRLDRAVAAAARFSPGRVLVEEHVEGEDHRLLVVEGRFLVALHRVAGGIVGDGVSTVEELVRRLNADPRRGTGRDSVMKQLPLDAEALECLADQGLQVDSVPAAGLRITLRRTANVSTGGTLRDVTEAVHPDNRRLAERAARIVGLDIAGVDFLTVDVSRSWRDVGGVITEVNAHPELGDEDRDVSGEILDIVLAGGDGRIPTVAIAGTFAASTTAVLLHHIWTTAGSVVGLCTEELIQVGRETIGTGNPGGLPDAAILLHDPAVQVAIIEISDGALPRDGHPVDRYDVVALLGALAGAPELLARAGQAFVINAEDPQCLAASSQSSAERRILVAKDGLNPALVEHRRAGGEAVFLTVRDNRTWIVLAAGDAETPLLFDNPGPDPASAKFAVALAFSQGLGVDVIANALRASPAQQ